MASLYPQPGNPTSVQFGQYWETWAAVMIPSLSDALSLRWGTVALQQGKLWTLYIPSWHNPISVQFGRYWEACWCKPRKASLMRCCSLWRVWTHSQCAQLEHRIHWKRLPLGRRWTATTVHLWILWTYFHWNISVIYQQIIVWCLKGNNHFLDKLYILRCILSSVINSTSLTLLPASITLTGC